MKNRKPIYFYFKNILKININKIKVSLGYRYIIARTSCLGTKALYHSQSKRLCLYFSEIRVDALNRKFLDAHKVPRLCHIKYLTPRFSIPLTQQQFFFLNKKRAPDFFIIDSFAELTSQKFTPKGSDCSFFSCYSLINKSAIRRAQITCQGLLTEEQIVIEYEKFIANMKLHYPQTTIIYIHYPDKFEDRELFVSRLALIKKTITNLQKEYCNLRSIIIDPSLVLSSEIDNCPYHFAVATYRYLGNLLRREMQYDKNSTLLSNKAVDNTLIINPYTTDCQRFFPH